MSGGFFDYKQDDLFRCADLIEEYLIYGTEFSEETIERFRETQRSLIRTAKMMKRVDYLIEGDDGEDTFHRLWNERIECRNSTRSTDPKLSKKS